jgi:hypothetical protein
MSSWPIPKHVSNKPLPEDVFQLPPNMQPQPTLTRFWCQPCIISLTTTSSRPPKGTVHDMAVAMLDGLYCKRETNFGVCSGCRAAQKGGCVEVSPRYMTGDLPTLNVLRSRLSFAVPSTFSAGTLTML